MQGSLSDLPLIALFAMEESADAELRRIRQAIHVAQEKCPHTAVDEIEPADIFDLAREQCRACRKIALRLQRPPP